MKKFINDSLTASYNTQYIVKKERFNKTAMLEHIYSGYVDLTEASMLKNYIRKSINKGSYNEVEIHYENNPLGRLKPTSSKEHKFIKAQTYQWNHTKYLTCSEFYNDIDIVNCHFNICGQLFKSFDLTNTYTQYFIDNKTQIMDNLIKDCNMTKKESKDTLLSLIYSSDTGLTKKIKKQYGTETTNICNFIKEIKSNRKNILNQFKNVTRYVKKTTDKKYNIIGSSFAILVQTLEKNILLAINKFFESKNCNVEALIHDGVHILKEHYNEKLLRECEKYVSTQTGFVIQLISKPFRPETQLENLIKFNCIDADEEQKIPVKRFKAEYLTQSSIFYKSQQNNIDLANKLHADKMNLVKSETGTGKTTMIKDLRKRFNTYAIISIVSRRSLADCHEIEFNLTNYQKVDDHDVNEVYQFDSIEKVETHGKPFILIIDEVASVCSHILNTMKKCSENRITLIDTLRELLADCKIAVGMDRNINQGTINFINSLVALTTKKSILFINDYYKVKLTPVTVYEDKYFMIEKIVNMLKNDKKVLVCSNLNNKFKREIVECVKKQLNLQSCDMLIYSGNEGEETINTSEWADKKLIAATPSIVYGVSSNYGFNVFSFYYKANHWTAFDMNQQINRERKPESINIYCEDNVRTPYGTIEQAKKEHTYNFKIVMDVNEEDAFLTYYPIILKLLHYQTYMDSYYLNYKHHLLDLLREKGYTNIRFNCKNITDTNKQSITKDIAKQKEYINNLVERYFKDDIDNKRALDILDKMAVFGLDNTELKKDKLDKKKEIIDKGISLFIDNHKYVQLVNYLLFITNCNGLKVNDKGHYISNTEDIYEITVKSNKFKVQLLRELKDKLGIKNNGDEYDSFDRTNFNEQINVDTNDLKKVFNSTKKLDNTRAALTVFYSQQLKKLFGDAIQQRNQNKKVLQKRYTIHTWNKEYVQMYNDIIDFTTFKSQYSF